MEDTCVDGRGGWRGVWGWLWLVFVWGGARRGAFIFYFSGVSSSIGGAFVLAGGLCAGLSFYAVSLVVKGKFGKTSKSLKILCS